MCFVLKDVVSLMKLNLWKSIHLLWFAFPKEYVMLIICKAPAIWYYIGGCPDQIHYKFAMICSEMSPVYFIIISVKQELLVLLKRTISLHHFFLGKIKLKLISCFLLNHQNLGSLTFAYWPGTDVSAL